MKKYKLKLLLLLGISLCFSVFAYPASFSVSRTTGGMTNDPYETVILSCGTGNAIELPPSMFASATQPAQSTLGVTDQSVPCEFYATQNNQKVVLATFTASYDSKTDILTHTPIQYNPSQLCSVNGVCNVNPQPNSIYLAASYIRYPGKPETACVCNISN